jgi:hypothetical protein
MYYSTVDFSRYLIISSNLIVLDVMNTNTTNTYTNTNSTNTITTTNTISSTYINLN